MKRKAVAAILALACLPAVHGQIQHVKWLEYQKVPVADRERLNRHCAIIPREPGYSQDLHCLAGWEALWVGNREDSLVTTVQAAPYARSLYYVPPQEKGRLKSHLDLFPL